MSDDVLARSFADVVGLDACLLIIVSSPDTARIQYVLRCN